MLGAVTLDSIRQLPEPAWDTTPVERVMVPRRQVPTPSPETDAREALRLFGDDRVREISVVSDHHLLGPLRRQLLLRRLSLYARPEQTAWLIRSEG